MSKEIDILLAYPKPTKDSPFNLTPLSILFPGALFEQQGLKVAYYDQRFDPQEMLDDLIKRAKEIGVSAFTGYQTGQAAEILERAKNLKPSIITGVGGVHARLLPEQVLAEPFVDKVWADRTYGEDLFPYNPQTRIHFARTDMQWQTSRGCPHSCSFCAISSDWVPRKIEDVDRELKTIHKDIGFSEISFSDPNIAFGIYKEGDQRHKIDRPDRIRQIGNILRDLKVKWDGNMRAPYLTPEMVDALVYSNCFSLEIGCESGNDDYLKKVIRKGHGVDAIMQAANNIRGSGVSVMYSFMAHTPRETPEILRDTMDLIDWVVATDPDARISVYNYAPYPGTKMFKDAVTGSVTYPKFEPPTTMKGWSNLPLMRSPIYWIAGLCFRKDASIRNFPGEDWKLIQPYIELAERKWRSRDVDTFPCEEVEKLIEDQREKNLRKGVNQVDAAKPEI